MPIDRQRSNEPAAGDSLATTLSAIGQIPAAFAELQREVRSLALALRGVEGRLPPQLVSVREAARALGCSVPTVRRKVGSGELASVRLGRTVRVDLSKLVSLDRDDVAAMLDKARRPARSVR